MKAVDYLTRAGTQSAQRSASPEAMQHFERALVILKEMPAGRSRDSRELQLQMAIGVSAYRYQGEGSADVGKALARAVELAVAPEDTPHRVYALYLLCGYHVARLELRRASEVARDLYEYVRDRRNPEFEILANLMMGHIAIFMGEFRKGEQLNRAAAESGSRVPAGLRGYVQVAGVKHYGFSASPTRHWLLRRKG